MGGIKPDIELPFTAAEIAAQRTAIAANPRDKTVADKYDPQLQRAVQVLDGKLGGVYGEEVDFTLGYPLPRPLSPLC